MSAKTKILCLSVSNEKGVQNPWHELKSNPPDQVDLEVLNLLKINEWQSASENESVVAIFVDIDAIAHTDSLDKWALVAWRNSFNELIVKTLQGEASAPVLVAYTREPSWERASIAIRVGARDITKLSKINEKVLEILGLEPDSKSRVDGKNLATLNKNSTPPEEKKTDERKSDEVHFAAIPRHAIPFPIEGLEGSSAAIEVVRNTIRRCAPLDTSVLIVGPTGSGKELIAKSIHRYSSRAQGPWIAVNCGAIAPGLIEAELFGHVKGAFTGAAQERIGFLQAASGGTLFLDEVSELPLEFQVKLLRALQEKIITPVGSNKSVPVDFRMIAATKSDLSEAVASGTFREDLLYRIRVMEISVPSLFERKSDILEISKTISKRLARRHKRPVPSISDAVAERFLLYRWPGNIRELENTIEHALTLCWGEKREELKVSDLPERIQFASMESGSEVQLRDIVKRFEREYIASTVRRLGGSKEQAAESLGLSLATLYRKLGS